MGEEGELLPFIRVSRICVTLLVFLTGEDSAHFLLLAMILVSHILCFD